MFIGRKYSENNQYVQIYEVFFAKIIILWREMEKKKLLWLFMTANIPQRPSKMV